jgi:hypothetical protein
VPLALYKNFNHVLYVVAVLSIGEERVILLLDEDKCVFNLVQAHFYVAFAKLALH